MSQPEIAGIYILAIGAVGYGIFMGGKAVWNAGSDVVTRQFIEKPRTERVLSEAPFSLTAAMNDEQGVLSVRESAQEPGGLEFEITYGSRISGSRIADEMSPWSLAGRMFNGIRRNEWDVLPDYEEVAAPKTWRYVDRTSNGPTNDDLIQTGTVDDQGTTQRIRDLDRGSAHHKDTYRDLLKQVDEQLRNDPSAAIRASQ